MQSKARFLGHPVHQMLVVLPLGALGLSVLFDLIALLSGNPVMAVVVREMATVRYRASPVA